MDERKPDEFVTTMLGILQQVSGPQYGAVLTRAGLGRYLDPTHPDYDASRWYSEWSNIVSAVYALLGEPLTRLFLRNYGTIRAGQMVQHPYIAEAHTAIAAQPAAEQMAGCVAAIHHLIDRPGLQIVTTADAGGGSLAVSNCATCTQVQGAGGPICANMEVLFRDLAGALLGGRVRVTETECHACGAPHCKWTIIRA